MLLPIRIYPDPVLRVRCSEVESFDDDLQRLVDDMLETLHAAPGIGLAASQVAVEKRVALVDLSVGKDPEALQVLVNPVIVGHEGQAIEVEGCLSIPDFSDKVPRPLAIEVAFHDVTGRPQRLEAEDWLARAICHEIDHLDGVLFVDHLRGLRRERARRFLRRLAREQESETWHSTSTGS